MEVYGKYMENMESIWKYGNMECIVYLEYRMEVYTTHHSSPLSMAAASGCTSPSAPHAFQPIISSIGPYRR